MLFFLGQFVGFAMRMLWFVEVPLPPLVWKAVMGVAPGRWDLHSVNQVALQVIESIGGMETTKEEFEAFFFERFSAIDSSGNRVPLKAGGEAAPVTFESRGEYLRLLEHFYLHEFDDVAATFRAGAF